MSLPLTSNLTTCPHGQRGTTTCLYCRQEARAAARQRRNRLMAKVGLMTLAGAILAGLAVSALIAVVPRSRSSDAASSAATESATQSAVSTPTAAAPVRPRRDVLSTGSVAPPVTPSVTPALTPPPTPTAVEGRTDLGEGMFAERAGDQITVHFDTDDLRTRFDEKFERIVRATLPRMFGADVRSALDSVPVGSFVRGGDLLHELPTRGLALPLADGRTLTVWPITRAGRDGPIVDSYRAAITK
jgi:hypothetical protein